MSWLDTPGRWLRIQETDEEHLINERGKHGAVVRNIVEVPWKEYPNHFGGALSKPLVTPETAGARHFDYRISMYQPMAHVAKHKHKVQEQIYHVLEGEGSMEIDGKRTIVRRHDVIFLPPGVPHSIRNDGLADLTFIVVTTPPEDGKWPPHPGRDECVTLRTGGKSVSATGPSRTAGLARMMVAPG